MEKRKVKRILFVTLTNVGDAVLTLPVLDVLHREFPLVRIDVLLSPAVKDIFENDSRISKVFVYSKRQGMFEKYRLIKKLFGMRYDLIVDLKNTMIPLFVFPKFRTRALRFAKDGIHKSQEHLTRLKDLGINIDCGRMVIEIDDIDKKIANDILEGVTKKFVILNPGAKSHVKRWPVEYFAQLADKIKKELDMDVLVIGKDSGSKSPDNDRVVVNKFKEHAKTRFLDIVNKTNLRELAFLISRAKAIVTNDSAPLHIASAVGTPTVAIFGPTDSRKYGPLAPGSSIIKKDMKCSPCEMPQCVHAYECLKNISVDEVFDELKKICVS